ncbi:MAG: Ppx/GppA family phosphatase, partial [Oceanococcaceae bacterium]
MNHADASDGRSAPLTLAAVDLGSNSFHMVVMRQSEAGLQVVDRVREPIRLASGLQKDKTLDAETRQRALECLSRFGQILRGIPVQQIRVVGTNTLRRMRQSSSFLRDAEAALGRPVEVISGVEEARLIYTGVVHGLAEDAERRLVVDIGGGSTELIIGKGGQPRLMESVHMGCVSFTQRFFGDGKITADRLLKARRAAAAEIDFLERGYRAMGWERAIGSSGSVRSVWRVAADLGCGDDHISPAGIEAVHKALRGIGKIKDIRFEGLREDRRAVFPGSFAVLAGVFDALGVTHMDVSDRALREGAIYD